MRLRAVFSVLALFAILFAEDSGAQTGARPAQPTPEQFARMPLQTLLVADFKLLTAEAGWVSTGDLLLMTTDNGAHWKDISPPNPDGDNYASVFFHDVDNGWVLIPHSDNSEDWTFVVSRTVDGGRTWTKGNLPKWEYDRARGGRGLLDRGTVAFADKLHGWLSLDIEGNTLFACSTLLFTSDGGKRWHWAKSGIDGTVEGILAVTDKDIWIVGNSGEDGPQMGVSHDGGKSFQAVVLPAPKEIAPFDGPVYSKPVFLNRLNGYEIVSYASPDADKSVKALFATEDGGRIWKLDRTLSNLYDGESIGSSIAGSTWIVSLSPTEPHPALEKLSPGSRTSVAEHRRGEFAHCQLSFSTPNDGWGICWDNLSSTIDGGSTWTTITPRVRDGVLTTSNDSSEN